MAAREQGADEILRKWGPGSPYSVNPERRTFVFTCTCRPTLRPYSGEFAFVKLSKISVINSSSFDAGGYSQTPPLLGLPAFQGRKFLLSSFFGSDKPFESVRSARALPGKGELRQEQM